MAGGRSGISPLAGLVEATRARLWPLPVAFVVVAVVLGTAMPWLDRVQAEGMPSVVTTLVFGGGASAARDVLTAVAGAFITVTSLTFSLTLVTLQLASSQYSPRLLRTFVGDRTVQVTLGLFLGVFVYALVVLRTVREATEGDGFVPRLSVTLAVLLAVVGVVTLVLFLAHLVRRIRIEPVLVDVHREAAASLHRSEPAEPVPALLQDRSDGLVVTADRTGFVTTLDRDELVALARAAGAVLDLRATPGRLVVRGEEVARLLPDGTPGPGPARSADAPTADGVRGALVVTEERSVAQDPTYGLRQLVDVALRALSSSLNDPTTAVHALAHVADLTAETLERGAGDAVLRDGDGAPRVVLRRPGGGPRPRRRPAAALRRGRPGGPRRPPRRPHARRGRRGGRSREDGARAGRPRPRRARGRRAARRRQGVEAPRRGAGAGDGGGPAGVSARTGEGSAGRAGPGVSGARADGDAPTVGPEHPGRGRRAGVRGGT